MRQFDVFENPSAATRPYAPFLIVLQSHLLMGLDSTILAPLVIDKKKVVTSLDLAVEFDGQTFVLAISELASVPKSVLKKRAGDLRRYADDISLALNRMFLGF